MKLQLNKHNRSIYFFTLYIATKASVLQYDFSVLMCFQALCLHIIRSDLQV